MANTKSNTKTSDEDTKNRKVTINRAADYGVVYSDTARMSMSAYDIKITFSINEVLPNNDVLITEVVTVALSPQHAKDLAESLNRNVERYEQDVMPLNVNEKHKIEYKKAMENSVVSNDTKPVA